MDDTGFPVKAEEFVVLSQEPSVTETIAPKIARPFIEVRIAGAPWHHWIWGFESAAAALLFPLPRPSHHTRPKVKDPHTEDRQPAIFHLFNQLNIRGNDVKVPLFIREREAWNQ